MQTTYAAHELASRRQEDLRKRAKLTVLVCVYVTTPSRAIHSLLCARQAQANPDVRDKTSFNWRHKRARPHGFAAICPVRIID
jgi:hypothetical protein